MASGREALPETVQKWRDWYKRLMRIKVGQDQRTNTAPAYSKYLYKYRDSIQPPPLALCGHPCGAEDAFCRRCGVAVTSLSFSDNQLKQEIERWQWTAKNFGQQLKSSGNVVYIRACAEGPGYCLTIDTNCVDSFVAVGDRVFNTDPLGRF
jgi:hypothetical protein